MPVRLVADWMSQGDERLLEVLEASGPRTPTRLAEDDRIGMVRPHINTRLAKLARAGMVENLGNGVYQITPTGRALLEGTFDGSEAPEP